MKKIALAVAGTVLTLASCGGGDGRPSVAEVEEAILSEDNVFNAFTEGADETVVSCMAEALHGSDLSDDALQAIVDGDEGFEGSSDDEQAIADIAEELVSCSMA
jgi:hypothetical protein